MARIARGPRAHVARGFALGGGAVMAFRTGPRQNPVVSKEGRSPVRGAVTTVTVDRRRQVVRRLKGGNDTAARRMALHTLRRSSSEYALQMAPLAYDLRMAAAELEAGTAVIEFDIGTTGTILGPRLARPDEAQAQHERDKEHSDQPHRTKPAIQVVHIGNIHVHSPTQPRASAPSPKHLGSSCLTVPLGI